MKNERLQDAIGNARDEYLLDADVVPVRKRTWRTWAAAAACLCVMAAAAAVVLPKLTRSDDPAPSDDTYLYAATGEASQPTAKTEGGSEGASPASALPVSTEPASTTAEMTYSTESTVAPAEEQTEQTVQVDTEDNPSEAVAYLWWKNQLKISGRVFYAITNDPGSAITMVLSYRPATAEIKDFVFEGKTLSDWAIEAEEAREDARWFPTRVKQLLDHGDDLKLGATLYETGNPDGIRWDQQFYEEQIASIGEELLGKYIVNGEFLREQLEKDYADFDQFMEAEKIAQENYQRAWAAYLDAILPQTAAKLTEAGIGCERTGDKLMITVTEEQLGNLPLDDPQNWYFDLPGNEDDRKTEPMAENTDTAGWEITH